MATYDVSSFVVDVDWLKKKINENAENLVILDTSYSNSKDTNMEELFKKCHIPGASFFDLDYKTTRTEDLIFPIPNLEDSQEYARSLGVNNDSHVVIYDNTGNGGFYFGGRAWYTFILYGLKNVSVLDNGIHDWKEKGYPTTDNKTNPKRGNFVAERQGHLYREYSEVLENLKSQQFIMLDARPESMYNGDSTVPRSGHIPKSINISFGKKLLDPTKGGRIRDTEQFKKLFAEYGLDLTKPIVSSCKGGLSGCCLMMALMMAGATNYSLYHGSATEWLRNADLENIEKS